jgi:hypothetical protein
LKDGEIVLLLLCIVGFGLVGTEYAPGETNFLLNALLLLGAFYFVFGWVAKAFGFLTGLMPVKSDYWLDGFLILMVVALLYGKNEAAVHSVQFMASFFFGLLAWMASLA